MQRNLIDRGFSVDDQINWRLSVNQNIAGQIKSVEEIEQLWHKLSEAVSTQQYDRFSSKWYFFESDLCVTSSAALAAEFDFKGKRLFDMWDLRKNAEMLCYSIMATDLGGAITFTWLTVERGPSAVVASFDDISNEDKGDIFVQYCFLNAENTYFSRRWWDAWSPSLQDELGKYAAALYYEGGAFRANRPQLVNWRFGE